MCFMPKMEAPAVTAAPAVTKVAAAPTERDAKLDAVEERRRRTRETSETGGTGGLGDPSLAPVTKTNLGG
jgi:ribosomal protein L12E/L44/L45/RPP1/RPP2